MLSFKATLVEQLTEHFADGTTEKVTEVEVRIGDEELAILVLQSMEAFKALETRDREALAQAILDVPAPYIEPDLVREPGPSPRKVLVYREVLEALKSFDSGRQVTAEAVWSAASQLPDRDGPPLSFDKVALDLDLLVEAGVAERCDFPKHCQSCGQDLEPEHRYSIKEPTP